MKTTQTELSKQSTVTDKQCETNTLIENKQQTLSMQNSPLNQRQRQREGAPKNAHEQQDQQSNKNQINKIQNGQTKQKPTYDKTDENQEIIDLKKHETSKKNEHSTLLTGSSLLKKVNTNQLNANTTVRSFSGATIDSVNLDQCKTVLLLISGNDADNGMDRKIFAKKYEALITEMLKKDKKITT